MTTYLDAADLIKLDAHTEVVDASGDRWMRDIDGYWAFKNGALLSAAELVDKFGIDRRVPIGDNVTRFVRMVKLYEKDVIDDSLVADIATKQVARWATLLERLSEDYGAEITRRGDVHYGLRLPNGDILWGSWEGYSFEHPGDRAVVIEAIKGRLKDLGGSADGEYSFVTREVKTIAGPIKELDE